MMHVSYSCTVFLDHFHYSESNGFITKSFVPEVADARLAASLLSKAIIAKWHHFAMSVV
jgi:hypothetical protein